MEEKYALVDAEGNVQNIIVIDSDTPEDRKYTPPKGMTLKKVNGTNEVWDSFSNKTKVAI